MITFTQCHTKEELEGILALQGNNLPQHLTAAEIESQGFVTVRHSIEQLTQLNDTERHIIAKDGNKVMGYVLAMTEKAKHDIPVLVPMFALFEETVYHGKNIADYDYLVVGQVCIDKSYRGQGVFDQCYAAYKNYYHNRYDFAITEIAKTNTRSLRAHEKIGFRPIKNYTSPDNVEWVVVVWDWATPQT
jgi:ribosomal protein S18 acetylase RimI-like enzyme